MGATKWRLMSVIVKTIQQHDGIIFGGYVRDRIIHDHYATMFYNEYINSALYSDTTVHPESKLRTVIPNDIDCAIVSSKLPQLIKDLEEKLLDVTNHGTQPAKFYFPEVEIPDKIKHTKLSVTFAVNKLIKSIVIPKKFEVGIDVIHTDAAFEPPFGQIDFECNSIVLTSDNTYKLCKAISEHMEPLDKLNKLNDIIDDILEQRTNIVYPKVARYRIETMLHRGWTISSNNIEIYENSKAEDVCLICLGDLDKRICTFKCCKNFMHKKCMADLINSDHTKCPKCRDTKFLMEDDRSVLRK